MKKHLIIVLFISLSLFGCSKTKYQTITDADAYKLMYEEQTSYVLLDVRTSAEYETGHLKNVINISYDQIDDLFKEDKNKIIIVYCRSGVRAKKAATTLLKMGYKNIYDLGGIDSWTYQDMIVK